MFVKVWHEVNLLNGLSISQQLVCDTHAHRPVAWFPLRAPVWLNFDFVFSHLSEVASARVSPYSTLLVVFQATSMLNIHDAFPL